LNGWTGVASTRRGLLAERMQTDRLRQIIKKLQRHRFGRRAETLPEDQMLLGLEDVEQTAASDEATADQSAPAERAARAEKRRTNRGSLPAYLPRIEIVVDIDDKTCPCCQSGLHRIGEDKSERLVVPAQFRVLVIRRPKYACGRCEDGVMRGAAPSRLIGMPTEATVARALVSADHLPLYRQAQIYTRQTHRSGSIYTGGLAWYAAWHLRPLPENLLTKLKELPRLFADETTAPVLDPSRGCTKTGQLLAYAADGRRMGRLRSTGRRVCIRTRSQIGAANHASGGLQGHPAGRRLSRLPQAGRSRRRSPCILLIARSAWLLWLAIPGPSPLAKEPLERIAALYAIEKDIHGRNELHPDLLTPA
jgi:transposase